MRFLISNSSEVVNTRSCNKGRFIKYNTTSRAIELLQCGDGDAGRMILLGGPDQARGPLASDPCYRRIDITDEAVSNEFNSVEQIYKRF